MLLYNNSLLFIEIPRTGTTTLRENVQRYKQPVHALRHVTLNDYLAWHPEHKGLKTATFVRNPHERVVSLYEHTKHYNQGKKQVSSFEEFVFWLFEDDGVVLTVDDIRKTQMDMISIGEVALIDWIGRFENYREELNSFLNDFSLVPTSSIEVNNKLLFSNYKDYYDSELKKLVGGYYEEDLDVFKYTY